MKILHLIAIVVAIHIAAAFVLMSPGCSASHAAPVSSAAVTAAPAASPASPGASSSNSANLQPISLNLPAADVPPAGERFAPTRPGPEADAIAAEANPVKTYEVKKGDTLKSVARHHGLTEKELAAANSLRLTATLHPGQKLTLPAKNSPASPAAGATAGPATSATTSSGGTYTVKQGDTLSKIASRHGTTTAALRAANSISGDMLKIGQVLQLPGNAKTPPPATTLPPAATPVVPATKAAVGSGSATLHTVALGESAESIARKYKISVGELARANNLTDPRKIRVGQRLTIPANAPVSAAVPPPALMPDTPAVPVGPRIDAKPSSAQPAPAEDAPVVPVDEPAPAVPVTPAR
jgi:LysM repeat protein